MTLGRETQQAAVPCAAGIAVLDMRWAIEKCCGKDELKRALSRVSQSAREEYEQTTALTWVSYATLSEVHEALAALTGTNAMKLADTLARVTVQRSFTTVWRVFLRFTSDEAILSRTPAFYAKSRNTGRMSSRIVVPGRAETVVSGFPAIPDRDIVILAASIETVLTLAGRREVKSEGARARDGARFATRWRA